MSLEQKDVPGYEDQYYLDPENMTVVNKKTKRALKPWYNRDGYAEVQLWKDNKGEHKSMHRLFAEAYIPNPDRLPVINHRDEDRGNYALDNLEWCTQSYNQTYGTANEKRGPKISAAKRGKPAPWVAEQRGRPTIAVNLATGEETWYPSAKEASRALGFSPGCAADILCGRRRSAHGYTFYYA